MSSKYEYLYQVPDDVQPTDYHYSPNIVDAAALILRKLRKSPEVVCCAQMQSGKTDVMKRLIYCIGHYRTKLLSQGINISKSNIYLIICASSINLKNQLKAKLPEIQHHIYHLNDIITFRSDPYEYSQKLELMGNSGLIIFDECHGDAQKQSLIASFREKLESVAQNQGTHYYRVGFSATPYEQIVVGYPKVIMHPASGYYGLVNMFNSWKKSNDSATVFQAKDLSDPSQCAQLFDEILIADYYYLFRLPGRTCIMDATIQNIETQFRQRKTRFDSYIYDMSYRNNINKLLNEKPTKSTIIYLKDKLRMGEFLDTRYIYLVHDDPTNQFSHTTAQSLIGRCCGYNKSNHDTLIYCDYDNAYQHYQWIRSGYSAEKIPSNAKYIDKSGQNTKDNCIY